MNSRLSIASSLAGQAPSDDYKDGQVVESAEHEKSEEQVMGDILATVKDIQQKLDSLLGSEQAESQAAPQMPMAPPAGAQ